MLRPLFTYTVEIPVIEAHTLTAKLGGAWHLAGTYTAPSGERLGVVQTTDYDEAACALDLDDLLAQEFWQELAFAEKHEWYTPRKLLALT